MKTAKSFASGIAVLLLMLLCPKALTAELVGRAEESLRRGAKFFRETVSTEGGYLWRYSIDLSERAGEGEATAGQIWIQPPGTPSVGFTFIRAYQATGDKTYLQYALDAGRALAWGQLASGGWGYRIDFDPDAGGRYYYRREAEAGKPKGERETDTSTFDDNNTQSAIRLLMVLDHLTGDAEIHKAAMAGLGLLKESQFPNGAWPQRYPLADDGYSRWYTFNDNAINDCIQVLLDAQAIYRKEEYLERALKGGEFILLSQIEPPQTGWAQQYDYDLKPVWARRYEPPGVNSQVTGRNIKTLIQLYLISGQNRFLEPIPSAIEWLESSRIAPDLWARFYQLETNRPLYMNSDYELVYTDFDTPTHYSFQGRYDIPEVIDLYHRLMLDGRDKVLSRFEQRRSPIATRTKTRALENRVLDIISRQDEMGRWTSSGRIATREFIANSLNLSEYIELVSGGPKAGGLPVELVDVPVDLLTRPWRTQASTGE